MDTEYILDCAFEMADTSPVENAVLSDVRGAYWTVREMVDSDTYMGPDYLANTARERLSKGGAAEQYFFGLTALASLPYSLEKLKERMAHAVQCKIQEDLGIVQRPRIQGLRNDVAAWTAPLLRQEADVSEGLVRMMLSDAFSPHAQRWGEDIRLMAQAAQWYQADAGESFNQLLCTESFIKNQTTQENPLFQRLLEAHKKQMRALRAREASMHAKAKAAIKKATKLFQSLGKEDSLNLFVSGSEVVLSHPESPLKFVLKPLSVQGWLIDRTQVGRAHTPYELSVLTKDDVFLSKLCVYFKDTPVLDQLLALSLFVESGDEIQILRKANWFALQDWTPEKSAVILGKYPELENKLPRKNSEQDRPAQKQIMLDSGFLRAMNHWEPFKGRVDQWIATWMEPATAAAQALERQFGDVVQRIREADRSVRELHLREVERSLTLSQ